MLLDQIKEPNDIKKIPMEQLPQLAEEIRSFILEKVSETGGHLASNLGAIELTMALHYFMDFPEDKIVWDVGHQSYTHKLLTGRRDGFDHLRQYGGMSGFPKTKESDCDAFNTGHSSTSISAALGIATARELSGDNYKVAAVIGDGAMTGGLAYEALNNAARIKSNFMIIYNDNEMSISENVGTLSKNLSGIRTDERYQGLKDAVEQSLSHNTVGKHIANNIRKTKNSIKQMVVPEMFFEDMGITYVGPVSGYDIPAMVKLFREASRRNGPVLVHIKTVKGKGYKPAEQHPSKFHGINPFDLETGETPKSKTPKYQDVFSLVMRKLGEENPRLVAITAAMSDGTGLSRFKKNFPKRFFDVGIAEEHAVTFAGGLAISDQIPVFAVYSSFLQRAYDQVIHDVAMQNLHVIFAIDRAGLVGADGETHHGIFDISALSTVPNMTLMAPKNRWELNDMLRFAVDADGPIAIRYPRGEAWTGYKEKREKIVLGKSEILSSGSRVALVAYGSMVKQAASVAKQLKEDGINATVVNLRFVKPLDLEMLDGLVADHDLIVTMEEGALRGGIGEAIDAYYLNCKADVKVLNIGIEDEYVPHGSVPQLFELCGLDADSITERIRGQLK